MQQRSGLLDTTRSALECRLINREALSKALQNQANCDCAVDLLHIQEVTSRSAKQLGGRNIFRNWDDVESSNKFQIKVSDGKFSNAEL